MKPDRNRPRPIAEQDIWKALCGVNDSLQINFSLPPRDQLVTLPDQQDTTFTATRAGGEAPLSHRVRDAVFWRSGSQIVAQAVMWISTIVVVRLLDPHDYGLFAMTQVVLVLFNFLNGYSFASSLIQDNTISRERIAQVFGLLIVLNGGLATIQFLTAPLAADYFNQPDIVPLLRAQCLLYLFTPVVALTGALLARGLEFRKQAISNFAGALAGAITALACAYGGLGVWTLIAAPLALLAVRAVGLGIATGGVPMPSFRFTELSGVLGFGGALLAAQFFWIIQSQADIVIAGRSLNPHDLGLYAEALFLTLIFTAKFIPPLNEVAFPAYVQLAREGGSVAGAFLTSARLTMLVALPLYVGMALVAAPLVATLFGTKWLPMAPLVAGLAPAIPFLALQIICSPATNALGKPGIYVRTSAAGAGIMALFFIIGSQWGTRGLVYAWQAGTPLLLAVTLAVTLPVIRCRMIDLLRALLPGLVAAGMMALALLAARPFAQSLPAAAELGILVALGAAVYCGLLWRFSPATVGELHMLLVRRRIPGPAS